PGEWRQRLAATSVLLIGLAATLLMTKRVYRFAGTLLFAAILCVIGSRGSVYSPLHLVQWQLRFVDTAAHRVLLQAWFLAALIALVSSFGLILLWRRNKRLSPTASHGSAHWGNPKTLIGERGLVIGRSGDAFLRLDSDGHILTVAPTRSGKGVSCVIPNLLDHPGSALVTDPKGENYAVTSRWRRIAGHNVHALDPFDLVGQLAAYNPVDLVDVDGPDAADDARMLADMLVLSEGKEGGDQSFWNEEARGLLTGLILHTASNPRPEARTLTEMRDLLTQSPDSFRALLAAMSANQAAGGLVARAAARLLQKAERERSGVISTAQSHTHFLDSPRMARVLGRSTVDLAILKRRPVSIFLILPPDRLDSYARWQRLMIACSLRAMTRTPGQPTDRVLFLLDEFPHLGKMAPVQRDIGLVGGYGARFWLMV